MYSAWILRHLFVCRVQIFLAVGVGVCVCVCVCVGVGVGVGNYEL